MNLIYLFSLFLFNGDNCLSKYMSKIDHDPDAKLVGLTDMFENMLETSVFKKNTKPENENVSIRNKKFLNAWNTFKEVNNKTFDSPEIENEHKKTFFRNLKIMKEHNTAVKKNKAANRLAINRFADLTFDEYKQINQNKSNVEVSKKGGNDFLLNMFERTLDLSKLQNIEQDPEYESKFIASDDFLNGWNLYKQINGKKYKNYLVEEDRMKKFFHNLRKIILHNTNPLNSYTMGINSFADITSGEFKEMYGRSIKKKENMFSKYEQYINKIKKKIPKEYDARKHGYNTTIKDQKGCAACYASAVATTLEAHYSKKMKQTYVFSPQQIIDCSKSFGNCACTGGILRKTFWYVKEHGIAQESVYRDIEVGKICKPLDHLRLDLKIKKILYLDKNEKKLKLNLLTYGPIAVGMNSYNLKQDSTGIYFDRKCNKTLDHFVVLLGYGTEKGIGDYWLVQNSWGEEWGANGYFKIARNRNNYCGFGRYATTVVL